MLNVKRVVGIECIMDTTKVIANGLIKLVELSYVLSFWTGLTPFVSMGVLPPVGLLPKLPTAG